MEIVKAATEDRKFTAETAEALEMSRCEFTVTLRVDDRASASGVRQLKRMHEWLGETISANKIPGATLKVSPLEQGSEEGLVLSMGTVLGRDRMRVTLSVKVEASFDSGLDFWAKSAAIGTTIDLLESFAEDQNGEKNRKAIVGMAKILSES